MADNFQMSIENLVVSKVNADNKTQSTPNSIYNFNPPNAVYAMAYGGNQSQSNVTDVEVRLQKLERGQKIVRRGRVIVTVPQFKAQTFISQTSGNNPFTTHNIGGVSFPSGLVPDVVTPSTNNSNIRYPKTPDQP